jgi:hypothetical protein
MKISAENAKASKSPVASKENPPQNVGSKDSVAGMVVFGLTPGTRPMRRAA